MENIQLENYSDFLSISNAMQKRERREEMSWNKVKRELQEL